MYKTDEQILKELREKCIGNIYDDDMYDIIIETIDSENEVIVGRSANIGYDIVAYENKEDSTCFCFEINEQGIITDVWY